jgi:hypothetical protein
MQNDTPAIKLDLEQALEFIDDDELVEVTPNNTRIRKRLLTETERKMYKYTGLAKFNFCQIDGFFKPCLSEIKAKLTPLC